MKFTAYRLRRLSGTISAFLSDQWATALAFALIGSVIVLSVLLAHDRVYEAVAVLSIDEAHSMEGVSSPATETVINNVAGSIAVRLLDSRTTSSAQLPILAAGHPLDLTPSLVKDRIEDGLVLTIQPRRSTLAFRSSNAFEAKYIANLGAEVFSEQLSQIAGRSAVVSVKPSLPTSTADGVMWPRAILIIVLFGATGFVTSLLFDRYQPTVRTKDDIDFTKLRWSGHISDFNRSNVHHYRNPDSGRQLYLAPTGPASYHPLADLYMAVHSGDFRSILVTGPSASAGRSMITLNLAMLLAATAGTVLVVSLDRKDDNLRRILRAAERPGFNDILWGRARLSDSVAPTVIPNLSFIGSGEATLGLSPVVRELESFIDYSRRKFEYTIFFVPGETPAGSVEWPLIGKQTDAGLVVARSQRDRKTSVQNMLTTISTPKTEPFLLVNRVTGHKLANERSTQWILRREIRARIESRREAESTIVTDGTKAEVSDTVTESHRPLERDQLDALLAPYRHGKPRGVPVSDVQAPKPPVSI